LLLSSQPQGVTTTRLPDTNLVSRSKSESVKSNGRLLLSSQPQGVTTTRLPDTNLVSRSKSERV
jgi:hypothetical protein